MEFNLTSLQKKAIASILIDVVNADGKVTFGESQYFDQLKDVLGITDSEIEEAYYLSTIGCLSIIRDMPQEDKQLFAIMMVEMISADGNIDEEEAKLFLIVCAGADIPVPDSINI